MDGRAADWTRGRDAQRQGMRAAGGGRGGRGGAAQVLLRAVTDAALWTQAAVPGFFRICRGHVGCPRQYGLPRQQAPASHGMPEALLACVTGVTGGHTLHPVLLWACVSTVPGEHPAHWPVQGQLPENHPQHRSPEVLLTLWPDACHVVPAVATLLSVQSTCGLNSGLSTHSDPPVTMFVFMPVWTTLCFLCSSVKPTLQLRSLGSLASSFFKIVWSCGVPEFSYEF